METTTISGAIATPTTAMSKGFSSLSLLEMWMAAVREPNAAGKKVMLKVVLAPEAMGAVGLEVTEN